MRCGPIVSLEEGIYKPSRLKGSLLCTLRNVYSEASGPLLIVGIRFIMGERLIQSKLHP